MPTQTQTVYSVLTVEDDTLCRERFDKAINGRKELKLIASVANIQSASRVLSDEIPDILVVDIGLPDGSGIDLIRSAKQINPSIICLVVTIYGDERHVFDALAAGASGYLQKDAPLSELGAAIVSAVNGGAPVSPSIAKALLRYLSAPSESTFNSPFSEPAKDYFLTTRETEVLRLISKGYSREETSDQLSISLNTVSAHTKNIYRKLEVHSGTGAISKARSHGLIE